jgi:hypothetical protein
MMAQRLGSCSEAGINALHAPQAVVLQPHIVRIFRAELQRALARDDVGEWIEPLAWVADVDDLQRGRSSGLGCSRFSTTRSESPLLSQSGSRRSCQAHCHAPLEDYGKYCVPHAREAENQTPANVKPRSALVMNKFGQEK